jgi:hypothetical protein
MNSEETQPAIAGNKGNLKHTSRNKGAILRIWIGVCLAIALLLYAVQIMSGSANNPETAKARDTMFAAKTKSEPSHAIPPVDAQVPANIETATFALG